MLLPQNDFEGETEESSEDYPGGTQIVQEADDLTLPNGNEFNDEEKEPLNNDRLFDERVKAVSQLPDKFQTPHKGQIELVLNSPKVHNHLSRVTTIKNGTTPTTSPSSRGKKTPQRPTSKLLRLLTPKSDPKKPESDDSGEDEETANSSRLEWLGLSNRRPYKEDLAILHDVLNPRPSTSKVLIREEKRIRKSLDVQDKSNAPFVIARRPSKRKRMKGGEDEEDCPTPPLLVNGNSRKKGLLRDNNQEKLKEEEVPPMLDKALPQPRSTRSQSRKQSLQVQLDVQVELGVENKGGGHENERVTRSRYPRRN